MSVDSSAPEADSRGGCIAHEPLDKNEGGVADGADFPLVSVIMPCYNTSAYIAEAIDSVLAQSYPNKELIVIDDGSTDDTVEVVRRYGDAVRLIQQENQGAAVARNRGLHAARGEFITFLDSDDCWLPGKLRAQVAYLRRHPEVGAVFSRWQVWEPDEGGRFPTATSMVPASSESRDDDAIVEERSGWLYNRLLFSSIIHTITVMVRRPLVEKVGDFDPDLKRGQDYDYWLRISREAQIHQLAAAHALYRLHGAGCATKWPDRNYEYLVVKKALRTWGRTGPTGETTSSGAITKRLSDTCFSFGYYHYHQRNPKAALGAFAASMRYRPFRLSAAWYVARSLAMTIGRREAA